MPRTSARLGGLPPLRETRYIKPADAALWVNTARQNPNTLVYARVWVSSHRIGHSISLIFTTLNAEDGPQLYWVESNDPPNSPTYGDYFTVYEFIRTHNQLRHIADDAPHLHNQFTNGCRRYTSDDGDSGYCLAYTQVAARHFGTYMPYPI